MKRSARAVVLSLAAGGAVAFAASAASAVSAGAAPVLAGAAAAPAQSAAAGIVCAPGRRAAVPCANITYQTLNDNADTTFNQLLGINVKGRIAGYFGSGAPGHPNQGYTLLPTTTGGNNYNQNGYQSENFPGSAQTQVIGLNDHAMHVGFWSPTNNDNGVNAQHGWYRINDGQFHTVDFPTNDNQSPAMNNLLGVNNAQTAVGFYQDAAGNDHGYTFSAPTGQFTALNLGGPLSGATSDQATGINGNGDISGFATLADGSEVGFLMKNGSFQTIAFPGATATQALGVNSSDEVVGTYTTGTGDNAQTFGFTRTLEHINGATNELPVFQTINAPNSAPGTTTINGLDVCGNIVGFYNDNNGNTNGLLGSIHNAGSTGHSASAASVSHHKPKKKKKKEKTVRPVPKGC
jgi:hypothetical protein